MAANQIDSSLSAIDGSLQLPFESVYTRLQDPLSSHSRLTRLSVLRLLASSLVATPVEASQSLQEVVKMCLQAEESSLDVQGVRERVHYTSRLNRWLKDGDELGGDLLARWLVGMPVLSHNHFTSEVTCLSCSPIQD